MSKSNKSPGSSVTTSAIHPPISHTATVTASLEPPLLAAASAAPVQTRRRASGLQLDRGWPGHAKHLLGSARPVISGYATIVIGGVSCYIPTNRLMGVAQLRDYRLPRTGSQRPALWSCPHSWWPSLCLASKDQRYTWVVHGFALGHEVNEVQTSDLTKPDQHAATTSGNGFAARPSPLLND